MCLPKPTPLKNIQCFVFGIIVLHFYALYVRRIIMSMNSST